MKSGIDGDPDWHPRAKRGKHKPRLEELPWYKDGVFILKKWEKGVKRFAYPYLRSEELRRGRQEIIETLSLHL